MLGSLFIEISLIIILAVIVAAILKALKQPMIIAYIVTGVIASPHFLGIVPPEQNLETFAHIGIALLLFMVGLNLNPKIVKDVGKVAMVTGLGQVLFTSSLGFFMGRLLGFSNTMSIYIAIAVSFSSTIIIMKLLSDKNDLESLYGRISVGFLIVQDLIAVFALLFISSLSTNLDLSGVILTTVITVAGLIGILALLSLFVLPRITKIIAKSQEFLLLFSIGWCFTLALIFDYFNLSIEIGALLAGVSLSLSPYRYEISSKLRPIRDFFLIIFFIFLGSQLVFEEILMYTIPIICFSLLILIGNPLIVMIIMGVMGYTKRNSFLAGLTVAQISEFSLIFVTLGISVGHLDRGALSLLTVVGILTIITCTYMVLYSNKIYATIAPFLSIFERKGNKIDAHKYHHEKPYDILLFGYNRVGYDLIHSLRKLKKEFLIVDYNPETIKNLAGEGFHCRYGDASDSELLNDLEMTKAKMIISSVPDLDANLLLINKVREYNKKAIVVVISNQIDEALKLYEEGATYVIMPHFLGGQHASTMIEDNKLDLKKFLKNKVKHLEYLKIRHKVRNLHPLEDKH